MKRLLIILFLPLLLGSQELAAATDISKAIIYMPCRFMDVEDANEGFSMMELLLLTTEVYAPTSSGDRVVLKLDEDYTLKVKNSEGAFVDEMRDKGIYTVVVEGIGDYEGVATKSMHVIEGGNWESHRAASFSNIDTENKIITITSEEELALLAYAFNSTVYDQVPYIWYTIRLDRDLDLSQYTWIPIGVKEPGDDVAFCGYLDAQGHTISGIHFDRSNKNVGALYPLGLFGNILHDSAINDLTITESQIISGHNSWVGGIAGYVGLNTKITNCHATSSVDVICSYGTTNSTDGDTYGGIAGYNFGTISGCTSAANVFKCLSAEHCSKFGGIVGECGNQKNIINCLYYGDHIFADSNIGAIAGNIEGSNSSSVSHCYYTSTLCKGCNDNDIATITKVEAFDKNDVLGVDYGGNLTTSYSYGGMNVYPNVMEYQDCYYTLPGNIRSLEGSGTEEAPFLIRTTGEMDLLASAVNNGTYYEGRHFILCNDLAYDGTTDNNYTALGYWDGSKGSYFQGVFDGNNHSISGINIYKSGSTDTDNFQGVFGWAGPHATVKNLIVRDSKFSAHNYTGAIVGYNEGKVENCHVVDGVNIKAVVGRTYDHGGIVGYNTESGEVTGCSSVVTMDEGENGACGELGGIAGLNEGSLKDNLVLGSDISGTTYVGAIVGHQVKGTLDSNFYSAVNWTEADNTKTTDIGYGGSGSVSSDWEDSDGAVPAFRDNADNQTAIEMVSNRADYFSTCNLEELSAVDVVLNGRTLYKDGAWNTLCLPFGYSTDKAPLAGATIMELSDASYDNSTGTLNLHFTQVDGEIIAAHPYIIKWEEDVDQASPRFSQVLVTDNQPAEVTKGDVVSMKGCFGPVNLVANDRKKLYLGSGSMLYYPSKDLTVNSFRAYLELQNGLECVASSATNGVNSFVLHFGDEVNGIEETPTLKSLYSNPQGYFSIDGRRISGTPTQKGVYILNGKKTVIE